MSTFPTSGMQQGHKTKLHKQSAGNNTSTLLKSLSGYPTLMTTAKLVDQKEGRE